MQPRDIEKRARRILGEVFDESEVQTPADDSGADFRVDSNRTSLAVVVKATDQRDVEAMKGRLATGILEWQKRGDVYDDPLLVFLFAPRIGHRAVSQLEEFVAEFAPEMAWGAFDDRGTLCLRIPQLGIETTEFGENTDEKARQTTHNKRAFTDLNRWLLKVLLLHDAPAGMGHEEEKYRKAIKNPADLHRVAEVSQAKAYQFARTFRDIGLLEWDRKHFRIPEKRRLFERWREDEHQLGVEKHPVRSIINPDPTLEDIFANVGSELNYAIGGFEACRLHDVLHTTRRTPEVHVFEHFARASNELGVERCPKHEADLFLVSMPYRQSIQRGTLRRGQLQVVDILQAALDADRHPTRGREQADYIVNEVLGWS